MARYLFLTWDGAGNQPPAVGIARALLRRGHHVTFAGYESQREFFARRGLRFVLLEHSSAAWQRASPDSRLAAKVRTVWASSSHFRDVPELIARERCDALVVDCLMFGALAATESAEIPTAVLVHSAPGALMPPRGQFEAILREPVNQMRIEAGRPTVETLWDAWALFPTLCTSIRELDPRATDAPESFSYVGPVFEDVRPSGWQSPWMPEDPRPLVLVSFSTGRDWDQSSRIQKTLDALANRDCRILVTTGATETPITRVPPNAVLVRHVPHHAVLPHVRLTVTHAGHGTVAASLLYHVPMLFLPNLAADQPILARQVQALGAGLSLDGDHATPDDIRSSADRLLADPSFAANARRLADAISHSPSIPAVVSQLERLTMSAAIAGQRIPSSP